MASPMGSAQTGRRPAGGRGGAGRRGWPGALDLTWAGLSWPWRPKGKQAGRGQREGQRAEDLAAGRVRPLLLDAEAGEVDAVNGYGDASLDLARPRTRAGGGQLQDAGHGGGAMELGEATVWWMRAAR